MEKHKLQNGTWLNDEYRLFKNERTFWLYEIWNISWRWTVWPTFWPKVRGGIRENVDLWKGQAAAPALISQTVGFSKLPKCQVDANFSGIALRLHSVIENQHQILRGLDAYKRSEGLRLRGEEFWVLIYKSLTLYRRTNPINRPSCCLIRQKIPHTQTNEANSGFQTSHLRIFSYSPFFWMKVA